MHLALHVYGRSSPSTPNKNAAVRSGPTTARSKTRRGLSGAGRAATCLGFAALATRAAAEVDLMQVHGPGRLRLDSGTSSKLGTWRASPDTFTRAEARAFAAVLSDPPCFAAYVAEEGHSWPDVANFSLAYATAGLQIATSQIEPEILSCAVGRVQVAARNHPALFRQAHNKQDDGDAALWFLLGLVFFAVVFARSVPLRDSSSATSTAQNIPLSSRVSPTATSNASPLQPSNDVAPPEYTEPEEQPLLTAAAENHVADMV